MYICIYTYIYGDGGEREMKKGREMNFVLKEICWNPYLWHWWIWLGNMFFADVIKWREKEMATHSIVLAWRIPGTGEPGGLPSMGLHRVGHDWSDLAAAAAVFHGMDILLIGCSQIFTITNKVKFQTRGISFLSQNRTEYFQQQWSSYRHSIFDC